MAKTPVKPEVTRPIVTQQRGLAKELRKIAPLYEKATKGGKGK